MKMQSINPATEEVLATFDELTAAQVEDALAKAELAFGRWRRIDFSERSSLMRRAAGYLRQHKGRFAALITAEMGKAIVQSEGEVEKCAWCCEFYAENAHGFLAPTEIASDAASSFVRFDPLGAVLAVMPWNFPFWQVMRFAAPALMAGNVGLLKHASNVPQCALALEEVFRESGFPAGVFQTLLISSAAVSRVIEDERVRAVTLTGSDVTGAKVAEASGRVLKKTVLELGGADPFIVLADADLKAAAAVGARARNQNAGQSCIAAKRFIVEAAVADEFERLLVEAIARLKVGDPMHRETDVGPLARADLRDDLDNQIRRSLAQGARVLLGGKRAGERGYFYAPTVLTGVGPDCTAFQEETFGPLAAVIRARDGAEAIALANRSRFGLGASLWTRDLDRAWKMAAEIETGMVFINAMVASDPRLPFGGIKRSGYGRELAEFGIREFVNIKTVWTAPAKGSA
jgi:succinate-semialdehyde dehydrogenase / glutarate-semialdehyde dehydrogenase